MLVDCLAEPNTQADTLGRLHNLSCLMNWGLAHVCSATLQSCATHAIAQCTEQCAAADAAVSS